MQIIKANKIFFLLMLILALAGIFLLITLSKGQLNIFFDAHQNIFFNYLFRGITNLGNGWVFVVACVIGLFVRFYYSIALAVSGIMIGLVSMLFKNILFNQSPRPPKFFEGRYELHFIPGVQTLYEHSFPSGHAMTAFGLFTMLTFFIRNKNWSVLFFLLAMLAAVSRIYLQKHFLEDVYFGALMGAAISFFVFAFAEKKLSSINWMNRKILLRKK